MQALLAVPQMKFVLQAIASLLTSKCLVLCKISRNSYHQLQRKKQTAVAHHLDLLEEKKSDISIY
jgi:hypothetical protein